MTLIVMTMTTHSQDSEPRKWSWVKGQIISRFHTIKDAAKKCGCHPNAFRLAAVGECPRIITWLKSHGISL